MYICSCIYIYIYIHTYRDLHFIFSATSTNHNNHHHNDTNTNVTNTNYSTTNAHVVFCLFLSYCYPWDKLGILLFIGINFVFYSSFCHRMSKQ